MINKFRFGALMTHGCISDPIKYRYYTEIKEFFGQFEFLRKEIFINPFTGDFDLPKRICLNGLIWFSFDKVRHF
jgi:hypothetical protein